MLRTSLFRSDSAPVLNSSSAAAAVWTNTREASPAETLVPMPTLTFGFHPSGSISFVGSTLSQRPIPNGRDELAVGSAPAPRKAPSDGEALSAPSDEAEAAGLDERSLRTEPAADSHIDAELDGPVSDQATDEETTSVVEAMDPSPSAATEQLAVESASQSAGSHTIELSIDSLPHFQLIEPIPVTINSLGDRLFTATVADLRLSGTGDTLGDALVIVKEQLESLYERLARGTDLSNDENSDLQYLHSHIKSAGEPSRSKRTLWR